MIQDAFSAAWLLITTFDPYLIAILLLSLQVSLSAVLLASVIGFPIGAWLAISRFPGRQLVITSLNALMGLPPVVVGLIVYLLLSRAGPLGEFGLLFTPSAMVIAQAVLVLPILAALTRQTIEPLHQEYAFLFTQLKTSSRLQISTLLWDARFQLSTTLLAGLGRALAEVGAVIIVGGNINHVTRVMTTTIALETSKGNLPVALGLGIILLSVTLSLNDLNTLLQGSGRDYHR